jgi:hypothetical protein
MSDKLKRRYWISFDLGFQGDYQALYAWLDHHEAKECGENAATFVSSKSREKIAEELSTLLSNERNPRIYLISKIQGGKFILGKRKFPPWKGYAEVEQDSGDET